MTDDKFQIHSRMCRKENGLPPVEKTVEDEKWDAFWSNSTIRWEIAEIVREITEKPILDDEMSDLEEYYYNNDAVKAEVDKLYEKWLNVGRKEINGL